MLFVKADELKTGMRLAKPIYNKNGVMLYERNSKLTRQGIVSVQNFGLIGVYVLEAAEPVPPMTDDDVEFERFQAMSIFTIKDILDAVCRHEDPDDLYKFANTIIKKYGSLHRKINFIQNIRSREDYVYKHSLNTAILCAMMTYKLDMEFKRRLDAVVAALLHDVGSLLIPPNLRFKNKGDLTEEDVKKINTYHLAACQMFVKDQFLNLNIINILTSIIGEIHPGIVENSEDGREMPKEARALKVAYVFDTMTAMNFDEEPLSEIAAVRHLTGSGGYDLEAVDALLASINILQPGVCVELENGDKGLVITANDDNVLEPFVLSFRDNKVHNLSEKGEAGIKDIMRTMDNRHVIDNDLLSQYEGEAIRKK